MKGKKPKYYLMTKKEKREKASSLMAQGKRELPLPLFEALHPEEVRTDSTKRVSELGLHYRSGKHLLFSDTVNNFVDRFVSECEGKNKEDCINEDLKVNFADFCLFGKKNQCVKNTALKKFREKDSKLDFKDEYANAPDSYFEEMNRLAALKEEIPF